MMAVSGNPEVSALVGWQSVAQLLSCLGIDRNTMDNRSQKLVFQRQDREETAASVEDVWDTFGFAVRPDSQ